MSGNLIIREGNTGILYLSDEKGNQCRYIPDCDLDKARALLLEFQEIKDIHGGSIKSNYYSGGYGWFPSMVSNLYWHLFYPFIMYRQLLEKVINENTEIQFQNKKKFYSLYTQVTEKFKHRSVKLNILNLLVRLNNKFVIRRFPYPLMFFRFSKYDFRSIEIREILRELETSFVEILPQGRIMEILKDMVTGKPYYYYGNINEKNFFNHRYNLSSFPKLKHYLFEKSIKHVEVSISGYIKEFNIHSRLLRNSNFKKFYGFDDSNGYIYPMLYACHMNKIPTIAQQHGAYVKRHASYIMENITPSEYRWFDKIIVWGEYWKQHLLKNSKVYSSDMFFIGSNKIKWDYGKNGDRNYKNKKNILIPYEFSSNSFKIGQYMSKLIDLGFNIFFKPRPDEAIEDQLEAYCLSDAYQTRVTIVDKIDSSLMKDIDIVAGTMTTLIYELLPYNKIVWIFDTEYLHLEDLVEDGYACKVKYEDLNNLGPEYFQYSTIRKEHFFGSMDLKDVISNYVLSS